MKKFYILYCLFVYGQALFAQDHANDTIYLLLNTNDTLIKVEESDSTSEGFYGRYVIYDEDLIREKDSLLKINPLLPQGICEYYEFRSYDDGKLVDQAFLKNKTIYSRRDIALKGLGTYNIYSLESKGEKYIIRKLSFIGCE
ncbi:hypothetical protein D770_05075 [Flammeovirgaceae bacterium 311]|nr:hypothetical protein D770_05075 [Flammeovirgaceae bacterium 311]